jgi:hypothetical protein
MAEAINKQVNESKLPAKPWPFNFLASKNVTAELDKTESCRFVIVVLGEFTQE